MTLYKRILSVPADPQDNSLLFRLLPAEIRSHIFSFALTDYPDPSPDHHYHQDTCYSRPSYFAPRKTDTQLLRACRRAYQESWFLPFVLKEQTQWLTHLNRAPPGLGARMTTVKLHLRLRQVAEQQGKENVEFDRLRAFAQMWKLEQGALSKLLGVDGVPHLHPRSLTLTIRHADWWHWEKDEPLRFEAGWLQGVSKVLSTSVQEFNIEIESLVRKKDQIEKIATQMVQRWFFKRQDGVVLYADSTPNSWVVSTWRGNSTWHDERWIRDETEPNVVDYYVAIVTFRPEYVIAQKGGQVSDKAREFADRPYYAEDEMRLHLPDAKQIDDPNPSIYVGEDSDEVGCYFALFD
ncbi:hypothetical protein B0T10DRAFT_60303 [Thelonectria olida]|uniref:Uncharacterized protein n=1 Tax=Thelonectria olida TaxID=1576542 RepID=A0A9P8W2X8_9HYPO|nr:hypothetical protein B0T10DRAFT_60303 [Thelonectria olida]